jgi:ankyrin repeat protein
MKLTLVFAILLLACRSRPSPQEISRAIVKGDLAKVEQLLRDGADPNARDLGDPPLAIAITLHKTDIALRLLDAGADPKALDRVKESMLTSAVSFGDAPVTAALLDRGVDPKAWTRHGLSLLGIAADDAKLPVLALLLDRGVPVDIEDRYHVRALHYAARSGAQKAVALLLDRGAQINAQVLEGNVPGETALHAAASEGRVEVVKLLLARGANRKLVDETGMTAAQRAMKNRHHDIAALLAD